MYIKFPSKTFILDVIKYCDHPRLYKNISRRWDLQLEVRLIRGETSDWRLALVMEMGPLIGGETSDQKWDHQLEVRTLIIGETNWRLDLQLEMRPLIWGRPLFRGGTSISRWDLHSKKTYQLQLEVISLLACKEVGCIFICSDVYCM